MRKILFAVSSASVLLIAACAPVKLNPGANKVVISPNKPPKGCRFVGQVSGNQGNFFTGDFTSNKNMEVGSMNDMRNKAVGMGANYVQMLTSRAGNTGSTGGSYRQTNVTNLGNAYKCPASSIGE